MFYFQVALLVLVAILFNYNITVALFTAFIFLLLLFKNKINTRKTIVFILVFLVFFLRTFYLMKTNISHLSTENNKISTIKITEKVNINGNFLKTEGVINNERVLVNYILPDEKQKIFFKENFNGGILTAKVNIENIKEKKNFYSFDYKKYSEYKGIFKVVTIEKIESITKLENVVDKLKEKRLTLINNIENNLTFDKGGFFQALVYGDKSYLATDDVENYKNIGISHLLAISGLHVASLVGILYLLFSKLGMTLKTIDRVMFIILPLYILLAGASPSVLRAGGSLLIYLVLRKRNIDKLKSFFIIFSIVLLIKPLFIFDIGFQLSFFIAFCLILSADYISKGNRFYCAFKISLVSTIASFPIIVGQFHSFSYIGIFSNIILVPLFSFIIFPLIIVSYLFSLISIKTFIVFKPLLNISFYIFDKIQDFFLIFKPIATGNYRTLILIIIFILILTILIMLNKEKYLMVGAGLFCLVFLLFVGSKFNNEKIENLKISGQDVYYVRDNKILLVNTGNNSENFYNDFRKKEKQYDIINEYNNLFNFEGIVKIDYLLITTKKSKISGYARDLVARNKVRTLVIPENLERNFQDVINLAKFKNIKVEIFKNNSNFKVGNVTINYRDSIEINKNNISIKVEV